MSEDTSVRSGEGVSAGRWVLTLAGGAVATLATLLGGVFVFFMLMVILNGFTESQARPIFIGAAVIVCIANVLVVAGVMRWGLRAGWLLALLIGLAYTTLPGGVALWWMLSVSA